MKFIQPSKLLEIVRLKAATEEAVIATAQWEKENFIFNYFNQRVISTFLILFLQPMCLDKMLTEGIEIILTLLLFSVQKNREA